MVDFNKALADMRAGKPSAKERKDLLIGEMFKTCLREVKSESGAAFLESLNEWWLDKGYLTPKQFDALKKFHDNL